jgi:hypothetical protein
MADTKSVCAAQNYKVSVPAFAFPCSGYPVWTSVCVLGKKPRESHTVLVQTACNSNATLDRPALSSPMEVIK